MAEAEGLHREVSAFDLNLMKINRWGPRSYDMEKEQLMKQAEYLKANSWKSCVERLVEIIEGR